jgi:hypothetical protein
MPETQSAIPQPERSFRWDVPIGACRLSHDDIKHLYKIIDDKQIEDRDRFVNEMRQLPNELPEQFQARRMRVPDACMTMITMMGINGQRVTGYGEAFLDSSITSERVASIYFDTSTRFTFLGMLRPNWVTISLDFTSPPPLDWNATPSAPTRNTSNYIITAQNEDWGTSLNARLEKFFSQRKTRWSWLHKQGTYDVISFALGFPFALWVAARLGKFLIEGRGLPSILSIAGYLYLFIIIMTVFRAIFSYARWTFPKVELISARSSATTHRAILLGILVAIVGGALWDAVKALW